MSTTDDRQMLMTHHGTIVFLDPAGGCLRHGGAAFSPRNVFVETVGPGARLVHMTATGERLIIQLSPGHSPAPASLAGSSSGPDDVWTLKSFDHGYRGLFRGDLFLSAEIDGNVTHSRPEAGTWELFTIASESSLAPLVQKSSWAPSDDSRAIILLPDAARVKSCIRTDDNYGQGVAVTDRRIGIDCEVAWDFVSGTGEHQIWIEYAALVSRPMTVKMDAELLSTDMLHDATGGWTEADQIWSYQASVFLTAGLHRMSLRRFGDMPHVRAAALLPVERSTADVAVEAPDFPGGITAARAPVRGICPPKQERVLVCVLAQTRAHELTWPSFKKHVLDELNADLALCIGTDEKYDYANPYWQHAKYRWTSVEYPDFADGFDLAQRRLAGGKQPISANWRDVLSIGGNWLGGLKHHVPHPGSGAILMYFRWLLTHHVVADGLLEKYDRIVVTRSDFIWNIPHPPMSVLSPSAIWFPDGEYHGGLSDRHLVVSSADFPKVLNLIDEIVLRPERLLARIGWRDEWNLEAYIAYHLDQQELLRRTMVFPWVMFSVRGEKDVSTWGWGKMNEEVGMIVKYASELTLTRVWEERLRTCQDWERLYAEGGPEFRLFG